MVGKRKTTALKQKGKQQQRRDALQSAERSQRGIQRDEGITSGSNEGEFYNSTLHNLKGIEPVQKQVLEKTQGTESLPHLLV